MVVSWLCGSTGATHWNKWCTGSGLRNKPCCCNWASIGCNLPPQLPAIGPGNQNIAKWRDSLKRLSLVYGGDRQAPPDLTNLLQRFWGTKDSSRWLPTDGRSTQMADTPWYHTGIPTWDSHHISRERSKDLSIGICRQLPDRTGQNQLRLLTQRPPCM